jgi:hypothetical protein
MAVMGGYQPDSMPVDTDGFEAVVRSEDGFGLSMVPMIWSSSARDGDEYIEMARRRTLTMLLLVPSLGNARCSQTAHSIIGSRGRNTSS